MYMLCSSALGYANNGSISITSLTKMQQLTQMSLIESK